MHNKSIMAAISWVLSVGGWFLFNILLSLIYRPDPIYQVKGRLLYHFGRNALWWLVLILIILSCVVFEVGVASLRSAWFPTDVSAIPLSSPTLPVANIEQVDLFQEYEQDLESRKRFEEAASSELQQGWKRGNKRPSAEIQRENEVQELLDRPRVMEEGRRRSQGIRRRSSGASEPTSPTSGPDGTGDRRRHSLEIQEMLTRRFGSIKR